MDLYTKGLDMGPTLPELLSVLHSNRAHAHSVLGNWRNTLQDSQKAVQLNPANLKVCTTFSRETLLAVCLVICCAAAKDATTSAQNCAHAGADHCKTAGLLCS